jgi:mono/diheme cytochrome c family protein
MMHCQGCHGAEGAGAADGAVPTMNGFVGNFLKVDRGREFLVRVPGSANADLSDAALAEVLNWLLPRISAAQVPNDFEPYNESEVGQWRADPLQDVAGLRRQLLARMAELGIYE